MSERAIAMRSAPAWPLTPPPWIDASMSNDSRRSATRNGSDTAIRWDAVGKYTSKARPLIVS